MWVALLHTDTDTHEYRRTSPSKAGKAGRDRSSCSCPTQVAGAWCAILDQIVVCRLGGKCLRWISQVVRVASALQQLDSVKTAAFLQVRLTFPYTTCVIGGITCSSTTSRCPMNKQFRLFSVCSAMRWTENYRTQGKCFRDASSSSCFNWKRNSHQIQPFFWKQPRAIKVLIVHQNRESLMQCSLSEFQLSIDVGLSSF